MLRALCIAVCLSTPASAQDFFTLKGHGGPIMDIRVSPSGQIATASFDNSIGLWDGQTPRWFDGHEAAVNVVHFGVDGRVFSAGDDFQIIQWDVEGGIPTVLEGHTAKVMALDTASDGTLASASWDRRVGLWKDGSPQYLTGHDGPVNDVVFAGDGEKIYSASADGTVRTWDRAALTEQQQIVRHGFGINTLILNEQDGWLAYGAVDGGTRLVHPETGGQVADFTLGRRPILAMAYAPDKHLLAVGDGEGYIMVIDTQRMRIARDFRATKRGPIWALAFSPDGQNIHAGGIEDIVYSWPIETLTEHGQMSGQTRSFLEDPETLPNGERQFKRKCSICHTLTAGSARKAGPSLYKIFGRRAGVVEDYPYSDTLIGSDIVWSEDTINDLFDEGPDHYIPGTKMPMQRITKQQDRDDLIAYLKTATAETGR